jgi:hypothetical protein
MLVVDNLFRKSRAVRFGGCHVDIEGYFFAFR